MSVFTRRTRTVSFRLSEGEYEELRDVCIAQSVRSMSDFARLTTRWWINGGGGSSESLLDTIRELNAKIRELDSEVKRLGKGMPGRTEENAGLKVYAASEGKL